MEVYTQKLEKGLERELSSPNASPLMQIVLKGRTSIRGRAFQQDFHPNQLLWIPRRHKVTQVVEENSRVISLRARSGAWTAHADGDREAVEAIEKLGLLAIDHHYRLPLRPTEAKGVEKRLKAMHQFWKDPTFPLQPMHLKAGVMEMVSYLMLLPEMKEKLSHLESRNEQSSARRKVAPALEILNSRTRLLTHQWTIEELAATCGYRPSMFHRHFLEATGLTPQRYITGRRISMACEFLKTQHRSILEVAMASGFPSQSRFYSAFKDLTGKSPAQWRKEARQQER